MEGIVTLEQHSPTHETPAGKKRVAVVGEQREAARLDDVDLGLGEAAFRVEEGRLDVLNVHEQVLSRRQVLIVVRVVAAFVLGVVHSAVAHVLQDRRFKVHVALQDLLAQLGAVRRGQAPMLLHGGGRTLRRKRQVRQTQRHAAWRRSTGHTGSERHCHDCRDGYQKRSHIDGVAGPTIVACLFACL